LLQPLLVLCMLCVCTVNDSAFPLHDLYGLGYVPLHAYRPGDLPVDFEHPGYLADSLLGDDAILYVFHVLHQRPQLQLAFRPQLPHLLLQVVQEGRDVRGGQETRVDVVQGQLGRQEVQVVLHH
jgi:hypothetical protein